MSPRRCAAATAAAAAAALALPAAASAHGLSGKTDLAIPTWLFSWAAAIVLVASFAALAALWPKPTLQEPRRRRAFPMPPWADPLAGVLGVALFGLVVYAGFAGNQQEAMANLCTIFVYVHFWVGVPVLSVLLGDVFRSFNPWLAAGRAARWTAARVGLSRNAPLAYPSWLGRWPAVAGILGFAWLELAYAHKTDPSIVAALAVGYAVVQLVGMALFGLETWSRRGDAFGVYFALLSRLSVWEREDGVVYLRRPLSGAPGMPLMAGSVALLCVSIGSTSFDGFSNGSLWADVSPDLTDFFSQLGAGAPVARQWAATVGLVAAVLLVSSFYRLGVRGMQTVGEGHRAGELAGRFAHTLIPIAFAYAVAHYFSLLAFQGQAAGYLASNPLGRTHTDLFGTANVHIDYGLISSNGIWYVQVGALVCGHVAGLILAHDRALALYHRTRDAARSQYWMLVVMVGFTSLGLWLLSAVNA
jgi:predicted outer membrane lipoprotein